MSTYRIPHASIAIPISEDKYRIMMCREGPLSLETVKLKFIGGRGECGENELETFLRELDEEVVLSIPTIQYTKFETFQITTNEGSPLQIHAYRVSVAQWDPLPTPKSEITDIVAVHYNGNQLVVDRSYSNTDYSNRIAPLPQRRKELLDCLVEQNHLRIA